MSFAPGDRVVIELFRAVPQARFDGQTHRRQDGVGFVRDRPRRPLDAVTVVALWWPGAA